MSNQNRHDQSFAAITAGVSLSSNWLEWPTLIMKGQTVFVNAVSGAAFSEGVRARQTELGHRSQGNMTSNHCREISKSLEHHFLNGQKYLKLGGMVAITGSGLVDYYKTPTNRLPRLLNGENVLFGYCDKLEYGAYSSLTDAMLADIVGKDVDEEFYELMPIQVQEQTGARLMLQNSVECEVNEDGTIIQKLGKVAVPLSVDSLRVHEAYRL